jgi:protein-disulfide isomerase
MSWPFFTTPQRLPTTLLTVSHFCSKLKCSALLLLFSLTASAQVETLKDLAGFDFSRLPAPAKAQLLSVLTDEFDACGRPLTLLASLKKGDACKHTKRLAGFAATLAESGRSAQEIIVELSKYGQSYLKPRAKFSPDAKQCQGPADAKITLVEFSDFECPYCAQARPLLEDFVKRKPNLRLCMMPYPLPLHSNAMLASQAVFFARDAGKFWPLHDALFENQSAISPDFIRSLMGKLGLDVKAFEKVLASEKYLPEVNASKAAGKAAQVESTPTLYVNGRRLGLLLSEEALLLSVEDETDFMANGGKW